MNVYSHVRLIVMCCRVPPDLDAGVLEAGRSEVCHEVGHVRVRSGKLACGEYLVCIVRGREWLTAVLLSTVSVESAHIVRCDLPTGRISLMSNVFLSRWGVMVL